MKNNANLFKGKKSFTILELVISITIFMILLTFLYKVLDDTRVGNNKFEEHIKKSENTNDIYKIIVEDIAESKSQVEITQDKEKNNMVMFKTNNTYYDPFYENITYMISSSGDLIRIESKEKFQKLNSGIAFYTNSFTDILLKDIKKFYVINKDDKYMFIIDKKDKKRVVIPAFKMRN
ncbi:MAG: PulJ/GspJ family protein [Halarcobacter sp.]